jgi:hypothetical protein
MGEANGSGWVRFQTIHDQVTAEIARYCSLNERNDLTYLEDGSIVWRRDPNLRGKGVAEGNECSDFLRMVAYSVFRFTTSTVWNDPKRPWNWNPRESIRPLVRVLASGWTPTADKTTEKVQEIMLSLKISSDGTVTGTVVE